MTDRNDTGIHGYRTERHANLLPVCAEPSAGKTTTNVKMRKIFKPPTIALSVINYCLLPSVYCLSLLSILFFQFRHHRRIGQRRRVAQRPAVGDIAQQAAHDLAAAGFRQLGGEKNLVGPGDRPDLFGDMSFQLVRSTRLLPRLPPSSETKAQIAWPLISCALPMTADSATFW